MSVNRAVLVQGGVGVLILGVLLIFLLPSTAYRFGYALPSKGGIPCRIFYKNRAYFGPQQCDRDFAYQSQTTQLPCSSIDSFVDGKKYQLTQVGTVPTVLSSPYSLFTDVKIRQTPTKITTLTRLFLQTDKDCYIGYALSGGP